MNYHLSEMKKENKVHWDSYVKSHPMGNIYQLSAWKAVIENTYGHKTFYLQAEREAVQQGAAKNQFSMTMSKNNDYDDLKRCSLKAPGPNISSLRGPDQNLNEIVGILPLTHIKHVLFGNNLISIPFCDLGGVLADNDDIKRELVTEAIKIGKKVCASNIELRNLKSLKVLINGNGRNTVDHKDLIKDRWCEQNVPHKVRMVLELPDSSGKLMQSFKSKLRSQIRKPVKEGVETRIGGRELLDDFYEVFAVNMKDLGSPVHSKRLFSNILKELPDNSKLVLAYIGKNPVAGAMMLFYKDTLMNPWASFLKSFKSMSPNMLLYWSMLAYACDNGFKFFDFGRCTLGGGTFKFKEQWGATPEILNYSYFSNNGSFDATPISDKKIFKIGSEVWKKLPVFSTKMVGPLLRKYIGL